MPRSVRPHGAPAPCPGPTRRTSPTSEQHERQQPAPAPNHGTTGSRTPVRQRALARQHERDQRDAPSTSSDDPDQRARDRGRDPDAQLGNRQRRRPCGDARGAVRGAAVAAACRHRLDLDHDREDHRSALRLLVQEARDAVLDLGLEQRDLADVVARRLRSASMTRSIASSMIGSFSLRWTKPRVMISGRPTTVPVCLSTVTTIMNMPSLASERRSRRTTSPTSPTDRPSTIDVAGR